MFDRQLPDLAVQRVDFGVAVFFLLGFGRGKKIAGFLGKLLFLLGDLNGPQLASYS
ncbi:hypothetical protein [Gloeobacter violaceus]|uniref:hypothetical protein n=1 Tax=Gloeobacter violaceus TaxID=33072 RepID=UPI0002FCEE2F|nr:hypothetical protein [Gloeobacter violaceus]